MVTSKDVANYFLSLLDKEAGDFMSNMKLQKLIYYAQGLHLAVFDRPLFEEPVAAWPHGPVVPALYESFKPYGGNPVPFQEYAGNIGNDDSRKLLDDIYSEYVQFSASKLRNMTHGEAPWQNTPANEEISAQSMAEYFKTQIHWMVRWNRNVTKQNAPSSAYARGMRTQVETGVHELIGVRKRLLDFKKHLLTHGADQAAQKMTSAQEHLDQCIIDVEDTLLDFRNLEG